jgi:hypothetical protein
MRNKSSSVPPAPDDIGETFRPYSSDGESTDSADEIKKSSREQIRLQALGDSFEDMRPADELIAGGRNTEAAIFSELPGSPVEICEGDFGDEEDWDEELRDGEGLDETLRDEELRDGEGLDEEFDEKDLKN